MVVHVASFLRSQQQSGILGRYFSWQKNACCCMLPLCVGTARPSSNMRYAIYIHKRSSSCRTRSCHSRSISALLSPYLRRLTAHGLGRSSSGFFKWDEQVWYQSHFHSTTTLSLLLPPLFKHPCQQHPQRKPSRAPCGLRSLSRLLPVRTTSNGQAKGMKDF